MRVRPNYDRSIEWYRDLRLLQKVVLTLRVRVNVWCVDIFPTLAQLPMSFFNTTKR